MPEMDMCRCSNCGVSFKVTDCIPDFGNHDGWELPPSTQHYCPKCPDADAMDDYFYSEDKIAEISKDGE